MKVTKFAILAGILACNAAVAQQSCPKFTYCLGSDGDPSSTFSQTGGDMSSAAAAMASKAHTSCTTKLRGISAAGCGDPINFTDPPNPSSFLSMHSTTSTQTTYKRVDWITHDTSPGTPAAQPFPDGWREIPGEKERVVQSGPLGIWEIRKQWILVPEKSDVTTTTFSIDGPAFCATCQYSPRGTTGNGGKGGEMAGFDEQTDQSANVENLEAFFSQR